MQPAMESRFISGPDIGFRLDDWEPKAGHNILLVTGHSGSGKTTIANELVTKFKDCAKVELDWFDHYYDFKHTDDQWWVFFTDCFRKFTNEDPWRMDPVRRLTTFDKGWKEFKAQCAKKPNVRFIVEGIQVIKDMPRVGGETGNDPFTMPILIKGTSAAISAIRAKGRNPDRKEGYIELIVEWLGYDKRNRKFMADQLARGIPENPADFGFYD